MVGNYKLSELGDEVLKSIFGSKNEKLLDVWNSVFIYDQ